MYVTVEDPAQPEIVALLRAGGVFRGPLSGREQSSPAARGVAGVGCPLPRCARRERTGDWDRRRGAQRRLGGNQADVVVPDARGSGVARRLLMTLEAAAKADGARILRLETGVNNDAALALYARAGFCPRSAFGDYAPDPLSVFMEKALSES